MDEYLPPTADEIRAARKAAGHTQEEAAFTVYLSMRAWQNYESELRKMPRAIFDFYLVMTGQALVVKRGSAYLLTRRPRLPAG